MNLAAVGVYAHDVNHLVFFLLSVSLFFTFLICTLIVTFVLKYRRSDLNPVARDVSSQTWLEVTWTLIPLVITLVVFGWGARQYLQFDHVPADSREISVLARQWMWKFRSLSGIEEINELHLPVNQTFKLTMISQDVIHSFYLPELRVKYDVLPGRYTQLWMKPDMIGEYPILCSQYCGTDHSKMIGRLIVMSEDDYKRWSASQIIRTELAGVPSGEQLFAEKSCVSCHSQPSIGLDHSGRSIGPNLSRVAGSEVTVLEGGKRVQRLSDDNYLRESTLDPAHAITEGFQNVMPSYKGQLSESELLSLIAYMKEMKGVPK